MEYYSGLDVSLKETFITIIDQNGDLVTEQTVNTSAEAIYTPLKATGLKFKKIGIESGQFSISLCKYLVSKDLPVICVDARAMAKALSARINKNDKNDALGIAQMMRVNLYKEVQIKSDDSCELKVVIGSRNQLVSTKQQIMGTVRGLLKIYGLKIPAKTPKFRSKVRDSIEVLSAINIKAMEAMLDSLESIELAISDFDELIMSLYRNIVGMTRIVNY